jgi:hypothetical protein
MGAALAPAPGTLYSTAHGYGPATRNWEAHADAALLGADPFNPRPSFALPAPDGSAALVPLVPLAKVAFQYQRVPSDERYAAGVAVVPLAGSSVDRGLDPDANVDSAPAPGESDALGPGLGPDPGPRLDLVDDPLPAIVVDAPGSPGMAQGESLEHFGRRLRSRLSHGHAASGGGTGMLRSATHEALCANLATLILNGQTSLSFLARALRTTTHTVKFLLQTDQFIEIFQRLQHRHQENLVAVMADEKANPFRRMLAAEARAMTTAAAALEELLERTRTGKTTVPSVQVLRAAVDASMKFLDRGPNAGRYRQVEHEAQAVAYTPGAAQLRIMQEATAETFGLDITDALELSRARSEVAPRIVVEEAERRTA